MSTICALSLPVPPSLSVAVAVATSTPSGLGIGNVKVGPVPVAITVPSWVSVQATVSVASGSRFGHAGGQRDRPRAHAARSSWIRTDGGALLTTIDVPAEVVLTPSDTETRMS